MYVCCFQSCTMHTLLSQLGYMGSFPWGKAAVMSYFTQPNQPHSPGGTSTQFCLDMFPLHWYMLCTLILGVQISSTHKTLVFDLILFLRTRRPPPPPPPTRPTVRLKKVGRRYPDLIQTASYFSPMSHDLTIQPCHLFLTVSEVEPTLGTTN